MKKILVVSSRMYKAPGYGARIYAKETTRGLAELGFEVTAYTAEPPKVKVPFSVVPHQRFRFDLKGMNAAESQLRPLIERHDLVIVHRAEVSTMWVCLKHAKDLISICGSRLALAGLYVGRTGWMDLFEASRFVVVSGPGIGDEMVEAGMLTQDKLRVLPGGFDLPSVTQDTSTNWMSYTPTLVTVSRINSNKGQHRILKAWPKVLAKVPNAKYVLVGPDESRNETRKLVADLGIEGSVVFTGALSGNQMYNYYKNATAFALLTSVDGGGPPIAVTEAMAFGLPVIVSDHRQGCSQSVRGSCLIVNGDDTSQVSKAVVSVLTNADLRADLKAKSLEFAKSKTWSALNKKLKGWIDEKTAT
jgi:glycosyltransferase involved in cell wall biosynthesis